MDAVPSCPYILPAPIDGVRHPAKFHLPDKVSNDLVCDLRRTEPPTMQILAPSSVLRGSERVESASLEGLSQLQLVPREINLSYLTFDWLLWVSKTKREKFYLL